jgi:hypothetical protein
MASYAASMGGLALPFRNSSSSSLRDDVSSLDLLLFHLSPLPDSLCFSLSLTFSFDFLCLCFFSACPDKTNKTLHTHTHARTYLLFVFLLLLFLDRAGGVGLFAVAVNAAVGRDRTVLGAQQLHVDVRRGDAGAVVIRGAVAVVQRLADHRDVLAALRRPPPFRVAAHPAVVGVRRQFGDLRVYGRVELVVRLFHIVVLGGGFVHFDLAALVGPHGSQGRRRFRLQLVESLGRGAEVVGLEVLLQLGDQGVPRVRITAKTRFNCSLILLFLTYESESFSSILTLFWTLYCTSSRKLLSICPPSGQNSSTDVMGLISSLLKSGMPPSTTWSTPILLMNPELWLELLETCDAAGFFAPGWA